MEVALIPSLNYWQESKQQFSHTLIPLNVMLGVQFIVRRPDAIMLDANTYPR